MIADTLHQDAGRLSGPAKAAALLFAMGRPAASRILQQLEPGELKVLTQAAKALGPVSLPIIERIAADFAASLDAGPDVCGSFEETKALLAGTFTPEQVAGILADAPVPAEATSVWEVLPTLPDPALLSLLAGQHPQVAAYLLTRFPADRVARLVGGMPLPERAVAMRRMLRHGAVPPVALEMMEASLGADIAAQTSTKAGGSEGPARLAAILNQMDPAESDAVLADLAQTQPDAADLVRGLLFSFDDVVRLSQPARATLFDGVSTENVVLALQGSAPPLREAVLGVLGARARRMVEAELARESTTPAREIAKARRAVADRALSLAERGQIELAPTPSIAA